MADIPEKISIIIMDDDSDWCNTIRQTACLLGHNPDTVTTLEEAQKKIQEAYNADNPYAVAVIDLNFETGKYKTEVPRGKETLHFIKTRHPYMACLVVSGIPINASNVLDLRDDYGLDYYVQKDHFDIDTFSNAIEKSLRRVKPIAMDVLEKTSIEKTLKKWENVRMVLLNDLANVKERAALKGINVDVGTQNEIARYELQLKKIEKQIQAIQAEIKAKTT